MSLTESRCKMTAVLEGKAVLGILDAVVIIIDIIDLNQWLILKGSFSVADNEKEKLKIFSTCQRVAQSSSVSRGSCEACI